MFLEIAVTAVAASGLTAALTRLLAGKRQPDRKYCDHIYTFLQEPVICKNITDPTCVNRLCRHHCGVLGCGCLES